MEAMEACMVPGEGSSFTSLPRELQELVISSALQHARHDSKVFGKLALVNRLFNSGALAFSRILPPLSLVCFNTKGIPA